MDERAALHFSDGSKLEINIRTIIQPISLVNHKDEYFTSQGEPVVLEDHFHHSEKFIPIITEILAKNEFFFLLDRDSEIPVVYQSSNVVKIVHN